jgi:hypothetical protein
MYHHSKKPTADGAVGRTFNLFVMDKSAKIAKASKRVFG